MGNWAPPPAPSEDRVQHPGNGWRADGRRSGSPGGVTFPRRRLLSMLSGATAFRDNTNSLRGRLARSVTSCYRDPGLAAPRGAAVGCPGEAPPPELPQPRPRKVRNRGPAVGPPRRPGPLQALVPQGSAPPPSLHLNQSGGSFDGGGGVRSFRLFRLSCFVPGRGQRSKAGLGPARPAPARPWTDPDSLCFLREKLWTEAGGGHGVTEVRRLTGWTGQRAGDGQMRKSDETEEGGRFKVGQTGCRSNGRRDGRVEEANRLLDSRRWTEQVDARRDD